MKTTIDRFGRVVVPKEMRQHFGLAPGVAVEIDERDQEIVIRQVAGYPPLQTEDGVLVFTGEAAGDIASWVRKVREDRNRNIFSGSR